MESARNSLIAEQKKCVDLQALFIDYGDGTSTMFSTEQRASVSNRAYTLQAEDSPDIVVGDGLDVEPNLAHRSVLEIGLQVH
ncbi:hypothetical protein L915_21628 [Phytophthora nicotianae]|uniref:Uncharacterized protein n=1 Tax=Phytophthora nicotianae TaxID=4792 RepID=W2HRE2_PHYNI|nr:hypothetical protein L915_21628 [Phytophthora nicotianae]ETL24505.1 hypothetical protein L916_21499 [Phytophthora nicotianae]